MEASNYGPTSTSIAILLNQSETVLTLCCGQISGEEKNLLLNSFLGWQPSCLTVIPRWQKGLEERSKERSSRGYGEDPQKKAVYEINTIRSRCLGALVNVGDGCWKWELDSSGQYMGCLPSKGV